MKKQDLYDLIEKRYKDVLHEVENKYREKGEEMARNLFLTHRERFAKLADDIAKVKETANSFHFNHFLDYHTFTQSVTTIISKGRYDEEVLKTLISEFRTLTEFRHFQQLDAEVVSTKMLYNKMIVKYKQEREQAVTLKNELDRIVRVSPSAKQASKKLEELGLDLSDIEEVVANNLPAVLTTSVDVSLFNK